MIATIQIDWLALYCFIERDPFIPKSVGPYKVQQMPYGTRQYQLLYTISKDGEELAYLQTRPHSPILNPKSSIIKVSNRLLYSDMVFVEINKILTAFSLLPQNISRIDICSDFNEFLDQYYPEDFIKDFVRQDIRKKGRAIGQLSFRQKKDGMHYNGLTFGSRDSDTRIYLYNKSLELKEQTDKPYIRDSWQNAGLDVSRDVWRLEISLKSKALTMYNKTVNRAIKYDITNIEHNVKELFHTMLKSLFTFVIPDNPNISRCTTIHLLPDNLAFDRRVLRNVTGSSLTERILVKQLHLLTSRYRAFKQLENIYLHKEIDDIKNFMITTCDLTEWYKYKSQQWDLPNYKPN